ncbi:MAG: NnrS family protein [Fibrobacteres bacterium]|nr:NnrS family protein [Fibrobacterota bacterium]
MIATKPVMPIANAPSRLDLEKLRREPYRLLFPLGIAGAAIGIGIWIPYFFWPQAFPYPGQGHAVIQIQGFLLCFIFGFLTTMLPKVLGVDPLDRASFCLFPLLLSGLIAASLAGAPLAAQSLHLAAIATFLLFAARRFPERRSNPPPDFLFIAAAMLVDVLGTLLKMGGLMGWLGGPSIRAGSLLQFQAFPLLLILGVGGFLLPKLFANGPVDPKALMAGKGRGMATSAILCALFLGSFLIEILGLLKGYGDLGIRAAYALRAAVWIWFLFAGLGIHKVPGKLQPFLRSARISMAVMGAGMLMPVFRPQHLLAWEHVIFLSGFLRLTLSIASRVTAAHAGRMEILGLHGGRIRLLGMLLVLALATRIATDFWPGGHGMHLAIAAGFALTALSIWGRIFLPLVRVFPGR